MIEYRRASINDIEELINTRINFLIEANKNRVDDDYIFNEKVIDKCRENLNNYFSRSITDGSFVAWIALDNSKIVATSGLCFYSSPPLFKVIDDRIENSDGKSAYIMNMYTIPEYRRQGIARVLFEKILDEARKLGYRKISLHATVMGRNLYKKYGFKDTGDEMVLYI